MLSATAALAVAQAVAACASVTAVGVGAAFGMLLVLSGAGVRLGHNVDIGMLILAGLFVMITAPVVAQRIGQLAYREQRADSGLTRSPTEVPTPDQE